MVGTIDEATPHDDTLVRLQGISQHVGTIGMSTLVVARTRLSLTVCLDQETTKVRNELIDFLGFLLPPLSHALIQGVCRLGVAQCHWCGEVDGQIHLDMIGAEDVGNLLDLLQIRSCQHFGRCIDVVQNSTVDTDGSVGTSISLPDGYEVIILLFIYAAEILGEVNSYYTAIPYWDIMLHTLNGFLCGAIGFSLAICLDKDEKVFFRMSPLLIVIVSFSFSMTIGVLWEFFEYAADHILLLDMQKDTVVHTVSSVLLNPMKVQRPWIMRNITEMSINGTEMGVGGYVDLGLIDTMEDLFVNFIGALTFSIIGWLALHGKRRERMIAMGLAVVPKMPEQELAAYRKRLEDDELRRLLEFEEEPGTKEAKGAQENDLKAETEKGSVKEH